MKRLLSFLLALAMCVGMLPAGVWADPAQDGQTSEPPTEITAPVENTQPTETEAPTEAPTAEATETTEPEVTEPETTEPETVPEATEAEETQPETEEVQSDYRLVITEQPEDTQIVDGTAYYYVGAELLENDSVVEDALLSYRWQQKTDEDWTDIEGQTWEVLMAQEPSRDSVFRCVVSWEDLEVISESAGILADEPENMSSVTHLSTTTKVYISPLYQGKITEEEVLAELAARPETCALTPDCYSWDEFNAAVKEALHNHEESFRVSIWLENQVGNDFWNYVINEFEHNGDPIMGDYAVGRYTGGTKTCDVDAVQKPMPDGSTKTYYVYTYKNDFLHRTTQAQEKAVDAKVNQILQELNVDGKTDVEKVYAIYDYMINHIRYDYKNLDDATYMQKYTAYAALVENTSVCMGYALAFYRLALACGVDARYIHSDPMEHAWDIVRVDGQYYYLDATWDEKVTYDTADRPGKYFLRGTESWQRVHVLKGISDPGTLDNGQSLADNGYVVSAVDYHDWTLSEDGTLTIPTGIAFLQSNSINKSPFASIADQVRSIRLTAPILRLPYAAFEGFANVESIVLSDTIEKIEDRSLSGCNSLKSIALPDKVTELPEGLFSDCEALESVKLPAALKEIRRSTFSGCKNLKEVTFGNSLEKIGENAFYGCEGLETAAFPDSLKTIEDGAFFGSGLKKLTLGANVETVGSNAFGMCNLEELTILSDKVTFGESAIWTSGDLNTLTMPASLRVTQGTVSATGIGTLTLTGPGKMADYTEEQPPFWNSVENVIIEDSVTQLGRYGLAGYFINHVELPEGITDIPEGFLWNNQSMESVRLPASVTHIGNKAFGQMNSSGEQYPTIVFTGKNLPKLEANAFVGLKYDVICVYPCNWTTKPSGSYGGASVWGEVAWVSSHILTHYPAQPATEEKNGWLEHWKCDACGKLFLDEKGERPTTAEEIVDRVAGTYILTYENMEGIENPNPAAWSTNETLVLQAPRQPGFRFLGWSLDQAGRQIVDSIPAGERTEITLYAQWTPGSYTVVYDGNGADKGTMKPQAMVCGKTYTLTGNAFTRAGYTFQGWAADPDSRTPEYTNKQKGVALSNTDRDVVTLYAVWAPVTYKLTYKNLTVDELTQVPQTYTIEDTVELPAMSRNGFDFGGWYLDGAFRKPVDTISGIGAKTIYAKWTAHKYTVTFHGNGADKGAMKDQPMVCGTAKALTKNAFTRVGYTFSGWTRDPNSGNAEFTNGQKTLNLTYADGDTVELYAVWTPIVYKITYKNLTADELTQVPQTYTIEDMVQLPAMARDGFDFGGWYLDGAFKKPADTISGIGAKTIYAKWTAHKYTVTFHGNGADKGAMKDQPMVCGTGKALTRNAFKRVGYTFSGWTRDPNSGNAEFTNGQKTLNLTYADGDTVELYAVWTPIVYKITYKNLTAEELSKVPQSYTIEDSLLLQDLNRRGYDFGGWYLDGSFKKPVDTISGIGAKTIYAKWTAHKYTVTFHGNGADKGTMKDQPMVCGTAKALTRNAFTRTGYIFAGWARDPISGVVDFTNGEKVLRYYEIDNYVMELFAVWVPIQYKITYKNLTAAEAELMQQTYTIENTLYLSELMRDGFDFGGWYSDAAFKKPVETISGMGAKTVYAKWTAHKYTVVFDGNGADKGAMKDQPMVFGTARALTRNAYTRTGYTFLGWSADPNAVEAQYKNCEKLQNLTDKDGGIVTLYAVWKAK